MRATKTPTSAAIRATKVNRAAVTFIVPRPRLGGKVPHADSVCGKKPAEADSDGVGMVDFSCPGRAQRWRQVALGRARLPKYSQIHRQKNTPTKTGQYRPAPAESPFQVKPPSLNATTSRAVRAIVTVERTARRKLASGSLLGTPGNATVEGRGISYDDADIAEILGLMANSRENVVRLGAD